MNFQQAINRTKNLTRENITYETLNFLEGLSEQFIEWNKDRLNESEDIYGDNPLGTYKRSTEEIAKYSDPPTSKKPKETNKPYNLEWHGSLFNSIYTKIETSGSAGVLVGSSEKDSNLDKWSNLLKHIGSDKESKLLGFTDKEIVEIRELVKPLLIRHIKDTLTE